MKRLPNHLNTKLRSKPKPKKPWKNFSKSSAKTGQRIKLGLAVLGILLLLVGIGKLLRLVESLGNPYSSESPVALKNHLWEGDTPFNVVVKSDQVYLLTFNPTSKQVLALIIPPDTYINLPFNFGKWPVRSIYNLGQTENPPVGAKLLTRTLSLNLGVPVDGYMLMQQDKAKAQILDLISQIRSNPFVSLSLLRSSHTDLAPSEYLQLWQKLAGVRFDKIKVIDLSRAEIFDKASLRDGTSIWLVNPAKIDQLLAPNLQDDKIADEGFSVGIYNTTGVNGLAVYASRLVSNLGGRVIFTANSDLALPNSAVLGRESYTKLRLTELFVENNRYPKLPDSRADVTIFLGKDFADKITDLKSLL